MGLLSLPIAARVRRGTSFAKIDMVVTHVPGSLETVPRVQPGKSSKSSKSQPLLIEMLGAIKPGPPVTIADFNSDNPAERFAAWVIEREAIRARRELGREAPWTTNSIMAAARFCHAYRRYDKGTIFVTDNIVTPFRDHLDLWFAITVARLINEPEALAELVPFMVPFDAARCREILEARKSAKLKWSRNEAYKMPTPPTKGDSTIRFLFDDVLAPMWRERESLRPRSGDTLDQYSVRLEDRYRIGPFLAAQIIADLKAVAPLCDAPDWWTFARPGPGSERGLNRVLGRPVKEGWSWPEWYRELAKKHAETKQLFEAAGLAPFDLADTQSTFCEFDKYERIRDGGKIARPYKLAAAPEKLAKQPKKLKADRAPEPAAATPVVALPGLVEIDSIHISPEVVTTEWGNQPRCLSAALTYAADRGWASFPAPRGEKKSHKSAKRNGGRRWGATNDPTEIRRDFARWPLANVGIPTGAENGIWVLEADTPQGHEVDGIASLRQLEAQYGPLPDTLRAVSPSGSLHWYFKWPVGNDIRNSASKIAPGIDVRGEGGMVLAPPSVKEGVGAYSWVSNVPIVDAPDWLVALAVAATAAPRDKTTPPLPARPYQGPSDEGDEILARASAAIEAAPRGERESTLNTECLKVGHSVSGGLLDYGPTVDELIAAGGRQGEWDPEILAEHVERSIRDGMRDPDYGQEGEWLIAEANRQALDNPALLAEMLGQAEAARPQAEAPKANGPQATAPPLRTAAAPKIDFSGTPLTTAEWLARELGEPDLLLGHILSTTTRAILHADTGLGKTNFGMAAAGSIGAGKDFLHWHCPRPRLTLYIDGEMSRRLFRGRIADMARRLGGPPELAYFFSKEDVPGFAPLNTRDGQLAIWALIGEVERRSGQKLAAICFDSIMALLLGDMKEEDAWRNTLPLVMALTARQIGQLWIHHTGHDASHGYGTKTREWQMDTVIHLDALENAPPGLDIAFRLSFPKARERSPDNRLDFTDCTVTLSNDQWASMVLEVARKLPIESLEARKFYDALVLATEHSSAARTLPDCKHRGMAHTMHSHGAARPKEQGRQRPCFVLPTQGQADRGKLGRVQ